MNEKRGGFRLVAGPPRRRKEGIPSNKEPNTVTESSPQATSIIDRLDAIIDRMVTEGMEPASIHLIPEDYERYAEEHTRIWRAATGSTARIWPSEHEGLQFRSEKALLAIHQSWNGKRKGSAVFTKSGSSVPLWIDE